MEMKVTVKVKVKVEVTVGGMTVQRAKNTQRRTLTDAALAEVDGFDGGHDTVAGADLRALCDLAKDLGLAIIQLQTVQHPLTDILLLQSCVCA